MKGKIIEERRKVKKLIKDMKEEAIPVLMKKINQEEAKDQDEINSKLTARLDTNGTKF